VHHVVLGDPSHGVSRLALQLSQGLPRTALPALRGPGDAPAARARLPDPGRAPLVHLHLTDALLGPDPAAALVELVRGRRAAITLHDVPQPAEGVARFARRARDYAALSAAADVVLVCSRHEQEGLRALGARADAVLPLPIDARLVPARPGPEPTVGVLGWVHPGKGHAALADALAATDRPGIVVALGGVAAGHEGLDDELARHCAAVGVGFRCTGYLDDMSLLREAARIRVPVCPHRHVSASGSVGSWLSAGRRPIVADGGYARELDARLPGALRLTDDLPRALAAALDDPASTVLAADALVGPTGPEAAEAQAAALDRWARRGALAA
jgi:glycosyltransferase involved in cell wall biosynthesis